MNIVIHSHTENRIEVATEADHAEAGQVLRHLAKNMMDSAVAELHSDTNASLSPIEHRNDQSVIAVVEVITEGTGMHCNYAAGADAPQDWTKFDLINHVVTVMGDVGHGLLMGQTIEG